MPPSLIFLRHAQAQHNVDPGEENYLKYKDPHLTSFGQTQAQALRQSFSHKPDLIMVSPLRRTLQTALIGLSSPDIPLVLDPELQEADSWPCDTGSDVPILESEFRNENLDFSHIPTDWNSKKGIWAPTPEALRLRATRVRRKLRERPEKLILVVAHGGFLAELVPGQVPYANTEWRTYAFGAGSEDEDARLTRVEEGEGSAALGQGHNTVEPERAMEDHGV